MTTTKRLTRKPTRLSDYHLCQRETANGYPCLNTVPNDGDACRRHEIEHPRIELDRHHPQVNVLICGRKNRAGAPCRHRVGVPGKACWLHGGRSLKGSAHPNFKGGLRSRHLPARYQEIYENSLSDPELVQHRTTIAELDARRAELYQKLSEGEATTLWTDMKDLKERIDHLRRIGQTAQIPGLMDQIWRRIDTGASDAEAWGEIYVNLDQKRKAVDSEQKRMESLMAIYSAEQVTGLANKLTAIAIEFIGGRKDKSRFLERLEQERHRAAEFKPGLPRL